MNDLLEICEINTPDQFYELKEVWNEVLEKSRDNHFFLTWEYIAIAIKNLKPNEELKILCVKEKNRIIAIAPLKQYKHTFKGILSYNVIEPLDYGPSTDYTGMILTKKESECVSLLITYLYEQNNWDFLKITNLYQKTAFTNIITKNSQSLPKFTIYHEGICPYIKIPNDLKKYLNNLNSRFVYNLLRRLRKLEKDYGKIELKDYKELGTLEEAMETFFKLHQSRWQSKKREGAFKSNENRNLFLQRARLFDEKGWFRLYFLTVNDKPVASQYAFEYNQKLHSSLSGFDPFYSSYSVGSLLILKIIERCMKTKIKEYDLMKGNERYKFSWTKTYRENVFIEFTNNKLYSHLVDVGIEGARKSQLVKVLRKL
jgi:hypothetical protein